MKQEVRFSRILLRDILSFIIRMLFSIRKLLIYKNQLKIESPCIIAVYHDEMLPVLDFMKNKNAVFITSKHHVGASLANVLKSWGYKIIYGSPGGRGKEAIEELIEEIKKGKTAIITPDGSRGPRHKMKAGAIIIAKKANVPLYLVSPNYRGIRIKSSWDKFLYPYPFSKVMFKYVKMEIDPALNREETDQKIIEAGKLLEKLSNHFEEGRITELTD